ncbi:hypothetical protein [Streptomyces lydicus]|uniref:hypothetical protein n=1 Tax=Streptomyces lydicus TaxID=47763 RepID=UPI003317BBAD
MIDTAATEPEPCALCRKASRSRVHPGCRARIAEHLADLPVLHAELAEHLAPSRGGDGGRAGTRTAPIPCSLEVLSLTSRGGIEGVLAGWEASTRELLGWDAAPPRTVDLSVGVSARFLAVNLTWICDHHPAVDDLARELAALTAHARRILTGDRPERRIAVACPCGHTLRVTISTPGARCDNCGQQYGHSEALQLPLANRAAA